MEIERIAVIREKSLKEYLKFLEKMVLNNELLVSSEEIQALIKRVDELRQNQEISHMCYMYLVGRIKVLVRWVRNRNK